MSEKVKYFAAYFTEDAGILEAALSFQIFLAASPLKSIKVSGAAGTKKKNLLFLTKKIFFDQKRSGLPQADYLTFAGNYGIYITNLYKSPGLARKEKREQQNFFYHSLEKRYFI